MTRFAHSCGDIGLYLNEVDTKRPAALIISTGGRDCDISSPIAQSFLQ